MTVVDVVGEMILGKTQHKDTVEFLSTDRRLGLLQVAEEPRAGAVVWQVVRE